MKRYFTHLLLFWGLWVGGLSFAHTTPNDHPTPATFPAAVAVALPKMLPAAASPHWPAVLAVAPATDAQMVTVSDSSSAERQKARSIFGVLDAADQYRDSVSYDDLVRLPVGIRKKVGNNTIELAIAKGIFYPNKAELTVYVRMTMPVSDPNSSVKERQLFFGADKVGITRMGGLTGDFRAVLLGDFILPLKNFTIILKGGEGLSPNGLVNDPLTYAEFSCGSGFKQARLVADVVFPREVLTPLNPEDFEPLDANSRVKGTFDFFSTKGLHDVLIQMNFNTPFAVTGYDRFAFIVNQVALDLSTVNNPTAITFPEGYPTQAQDATWQGVYIQQFSLILPPEFKKKSTGERVGLTAHHVLIDQLGFTGTVAAGTINQPVLPLDQGDASGWKFAVDNFSLSFLANKLRGGSFAGRISLPISDEASGALAYQAAIDQGGKYRLTVSNLKDLNFNFLRAKATIYKGSEVTLAVVNNQFKPKAILHGQLGIYANLGDSHSTAIDTTKNNTMTFRGIRFENLVLQTESPRLSFGMLAYERAGNKVANFPIVLESLGVTNIPDGDGNSIGVGIGISVNLMKSNGGKGFSGGAFLTFEAKEEDGTWKFVGIRRPIDIVLDAEVSAFNLAGRIRLYENEVEKGFEGAIKLNIKKPKDILLCARAKFGYNFADEERYWYVDALVSGLDIPVAGPLTLDGFAGGLYSKFRPIGTGGTAATSRDCDGPNTGIPYMYDKTVGLGFRAAVLVKLKNSENAFRGRLGFEIVLNRNYGISSVGFFGQGELMVKGYDASTQDSKVAGAYKNVARNSGDSTSAPRTQASIQKMASSVDDVSISSPPSGNIAFWVGMLWDLDRDMLHGEAEAYVNIGTMLRGVGPYGRLGRVELHFDPQKWYIHVGKPTDRLGVIAKFGPVSARTTMYMMVGHGIPARLPSPPPQVTRLINVPSQSTVRSSNDTQDINDGKGFAMGIDINVGTGPTQEGMFYGAFNVGAGVDLLMRKYSAFSCGTEAGSNGFYAQGQFYAYLQGEVGIRVKKRTFTILSGSLAGLMQGALPNPAWARGYAAGQFRVLGGLVKGKFNFKVQLGDECRGLY